MLVRAIPWAGLGMHQLTLAVAIEGKRPFNLEDVPRLSIADNPGACVPNDASREAFDLARRCWSQDPADRPAFEELMLELHDLVTVLDGFF